MVQIERSIILQIIGTLMQKPLLLNEIDKYQLSPQDFPRQLDKFIFSAIFNLYVGGAELIHTIDVDTYLAANPVAKDLIQKENGLKFLQDCEAMAEPQNFNYYYGKLKKLNLLIDLQHQGIDTSKIYCEDTFNENYSKINEKFEKLTTTDIINLLKSKTADLEKKYCFNQTIEETKAFDGIKDLIARLSESPDIGIRLQGDIYNSVVRGGRKGTVFLRSGSSGLGKSRRAVGDACEIAYPIRYDNLTNQWISTGPCEKCLYIMTEQDADEIQTMILAYLTGYNEEIFKFGQFTDPQYQERIEKALDIMEKYQDNFLFARVPDPCASVVKNLFRRYSLQHNVENFFFDYIFSSPAMLNEYRDLGLPEHVCLRLFTTTLKNLAIELHAFVSTSTQVSEQENDKRSSWKDYHNIAGARSIVHLVDVGCIMSRPTLEELKQIESFSKQYNLIPNCVCDIFKNRGGRWTNIRIWEYVDLGTCRTYDLFVTTPNLKPIEDFQIMEFITEKTQEELDLEEFYNDGVVSEEIETQLSAFYAPPSLSNSSISDSEAFGDIEAKRKQVSNKSFEELLNG